MSQSARAWTPKGALIDGALTARIEAIARAWAQHWFADDKRVGVRAQEGASFPTAREAPGWRSPSGIHVMLDVNAPIGLWMLGLSPDGQIKPNDEALLSKLAAIAARDLTQRAQVALLGGSGDITPLGDGRHERTDHIWSLTLGSASNVAHLIMTPALASQARLNMLPAPPSRRTLAPRAHAVARQRINLGAMIGKSTMAVADMRGLREGDVVLLDRGPADLGELTLNGVRSHEDACELRENGGRLTLRLASASQSEEATGS